MPQSVFRIRPLHFHINWTPIRDTKELLHAVMDCQKPGYFQTIYSFSCEFKSLVVSLDFATSPKGKENAKESEACIIKSLEMLHPTKSKRLLDALDFF